MSREPLGNICKICAQAKGINRDNIDNDVLMSDGAATKKNQSEKLSSGIYTLSDIISHDICAYHLAKQSAAAANIVVLSTASLIDPKIASVLALDFSGNSILIMEESQNIGIVT